MKESLITDHEAILLLTQNVRQVKEGQDVFHKEMKDSFRELKDDYANRLAYAEAKIDSLATWRNSLGVGLLFIGAITGLIYYIYNTNNTSIRDAQAVQDTRIDNLIKQINKI